MNKVSILTFYYFNLGFFSSTKATHPSIKWGSLVIFLMTLMKENKQEKIIKVHCRSRRINAKREVGEAKIITIKNGEGKF